MKDRQNPVDDDFWSDLAPDAEPLNRSWFLPAVVLLLLLSVPWYLPPTLSGKLWLGLPVYVWTTLACSAGLAALTSASALTAWRDRDSSDSD